jgi:hypothetical protein
MTGSELLREAGALVALGWCQHAQARTQEGAAVDISAGNAAEWSLLGALQTVTFRDSATTIEDLREALTAIAELIDDPSLSDWNDMPERTATDVTELLADAERLVLLDDAPTAA